MQYIYAHSCATGKPVKALNASASYVKHLKNQVKAFGMMFPSAIALLNGIGSISCTHNMKRPLYAPINMEKKPEPTLLLPNLPAVRERLPALTRTHFKVWNDPPEPTYSLPYHRAKFERIPMIVRNYDSEYEAPYIPEPEPYEVLTYSSFEMLIKYQKEDREMAKRQGFT